MIENPPRLIIKKNISRPTKAQVAAFQNVPTSFVADALDGKGALSENIQPLGAGRDIKCVAAGPAITAYSGPADVLASFAVLDLIEGGEMVVVSSDAHQGCAAAGLPRRAAPRHRHPAADGRSSVLRHCRPPPKAWLKSPRRDTRLRAQRGSALPPAPRTARAGLRPLDCHPPIPETRHNPHRLRSRRRRNIRCRPG